MNAKLPPGAVQGSGPLHASNSFTAHMAKLEKKFSLRARYENFIGG